MTLYVAAKKIANYKQIFAFSDDINAFFDYLRNYFKTPYCQQIILDRITESIDINKIIIENNEYEVVEYFQNVYVRAFELPYVENYLMGFYNSIKNKIDEKKTGVYCYTQFLRFLGNNKIQNIINDLGDLSVLYTLDCEYREKISEDN